MGEKGTAFGTVKAIEAHFGMQLLDGGNCDFIKAAREAFIAEHGSLDPGFNPLRRTADGRTLQEAAAAGDTDVVAEAESRSTVDVDMLQAMQQKRKKRPRTSQIQSSDYKEFSSLVVKRSTSDSAAAQVIKLLQGRGFKNVELLAVHGTEKGHCHIDEVSGFYYQLPED